MTEVGKRHMDIWTHLIAVWQFVLYRQCFSVVCAPCEDQQRNQTQQHSHHERGTVYCLGKIHSATQSRGL